MSKRVLSIGQCGADHCGITRFLRQHFNVEVIAADREADALRETRAARFDLVLVNRKLDIDGSDGLKIIRAMKADAALAGIPVMLVSNFSDAQQQAAAEGAVYGFGKAEYHSPEVRERLAAFLED